MILTWLDRDTQMVTGIQGIMQTTFGNLLTAWPRSMIWIKTDVISLLAWASSLMLPPHHRGRDVIQSNVAPLGIADLNVMIVLLSPTHVAIETEIVTEAVVINAVLAVMLCASSSHKAIARKVENADTAMMCLPHPHLPQPLWEKARLVRRLIGQRPELHAGNSNREDARTLKNHANTSTEG